MPVALVETATHLSASSSTTCVDRRSEPCGRTSAQAPQRIPGSSTPSPSEEKTSSAESPGRSPQLQRSESAGPEPTKSGTRLGLGCRKTSVTSDRDSKTFGFSLSTCAFSMSSRPGLRIPVCWTSKIQSARTPAAWAGPILRKPSGLTSLGAAGPPRGQPPNMPGSKMMNGPGAGAALGAALLPTASVVNCRTSPPTRWPWKRT
mmetsp:Transcript_102839/g.290787  ORF Transcript_102839/g.290787 Transcript_102839/m.290787 type:complete len:204 (-) Transcript_102839:1238-1849(-)